jgi:hypothetical protein
LIRAKHLVDFGGNAYRVQSGRRKVSYHHILLQRHQLVLANGIACETLYPGGMTMSGLAPAQWRQICSVLPGLNAIAKDPEAVGTIYGPRARPLLGRKEAEKLLNLPQEWVRMRA